MKQFFPLIAVVVIFSALALGYSIMYGQVAGGATRAATALSRVDALSERDALIRSQQIFLENAEADIAQINAYVASDAEVITLIETVEDTAARERVTVAISNVNTTDQEGWGFHEGVTIDFSGSGTFGNMMRFVAALEALPRASTLTNASFEVTSGGTWFGSFSITFVKIK